MHDAAGTFCEFKLTNDLGNCPASFLSPKGLLKCTVLQRVKGLFDGTLLFLHALDCDI